MPKNTLLPVGLFFLFGMEILRVYFIMPFPGSQKSDSIRIAYFLNHNILWVRLICLALVIPAFIEFFRTRGFWKRSLLIMLALLYGLIFYLFNYRFLADKMFYQPKEKLFASGNRDKTNRDKLIIGIVLNKEAKAYPIEIIGYHHQVRDTVGGKSVLVTYCTVCRTGRVYSPLINGRPEQFRLVGMDHFNAMFEDSSTKSWWQQATGIAIVGRLKGRKLEEIPSFQMRLGDWLTLYPNSTTLQSDTHFIVDYASLKGYDEGILESNLEKRDTNSWKNKSWVIGVTVLGKSKAIDWNRLIKDRVITEIVGDTTLLLTIEPNNKTFYVFSLNDSFHFHYDARTHLLMDENTKSTWQLNGICLDGSRKGQRLHSIQASQEFWHSWLSFHPNTSSY